MHIGLLTDSLRHLGVDEALDVAQGLGLVDLEFGTGNWSPARHLSLDDLLSSADRRDEFLGKFTERGMTLSALNTSGNQLHPSEGDQHDRVVRDTIRLAALLGVKKIVMMSGLPAIHDGDRVAPWITAAWPRENVAFLEEQWYRAAEYWRGLAPFAADAGIEQIAVEMHGNQLVYNAPTLLRLREAAGSLVGANMDPSHLMWMGADPIECVRALGGAIYHVHAKDTKIEALAKTRTVMETLPSAERARRAWNYVTLGNGHPDGQAFWSEFVRALDSAGYDGVLSIEHEDVAHTPEQGLALTIEVLKKALGAPAAV